MKLCNSYFKGTISTVEIQVKLHFAIALHIAVSSGQMHILLESSKLSSHIIVAVM